MICTEEYKTIENLRVLVCSGCTTLTEIPIIPELLYLNCEQCPNLTKIPIIPGLEELFCSGCTSLTEIPNIPGLQYLNCSDCPSLTEIPLIPDLIFLNCEGCRSLTKLLYDPDILYSGDSCPWISQNSEFEENLKKLIFLQKKLRRRYIGKKLEALSSQISEIYYSPGCKGYELAKRSFYSTSS